jgi:DNA-binding MarR family transcriptional regulator
VSLYNHVKHETMQEVFAVSLPDQVPPAERPVEIPRTATGGLAEARSLDQFLDFRLFIAYRDCCTITEGTCRKEFGVGGRLWRILATVGENDGATVNGIATSAQLDLAQTSRALGQLARKGYVKRLSNPENARFAEVRLTDSGTALYRAMFARYREMNLALLGALSEEMVGQLDQIFIALDARVRELAHEKGLPLDESPL